ncbi:MAG TPA: tripartite tricarboxylate transporter TctB family protein [Thermosynergistes sp.]|nr:tripartite tricarboxylate transporter TctB family protein [Thermosynergistes sp.]HPZ75594.1 tripartite tricarboxylate transporter TctB family protein [Thermosynergistes sp.]HQE20341.1 tripartite tricarboxylate transporter TctB family protein [Thermosynergistes sp.]HXK88859.1 tripartite tricarboxylate transporter TctB family protein [Thermosynergistes sp.]
MDMAKKNRITAIVVIVLSIFGLMEAKSYPAEAATYPLAILLMAIALSVILLVTKPRVKTKPGNIVYRQLYGMIAFTIAYYIIIRIIGYYFATLLYVLVSMYFLKERNLIVLASVSVGFVVVLYCVFGLFLRVPLPHLVLF